MMYVSCAHGHIYRNGSWFDDAVLLNEFSNGDAAALGPEIICELFPPYGYSRGLLTLFGDDQAAVSHVRRIGADVEARYPCGSGSVLARGRSVCVSRTVVYLTDRNTPRIVYETHRPNDRPMLPLRGDNDLRLVDRYFKADPQKLYLWIGSAGSANYGHWLVDDLPRLKAVSELRHLRPQASVVVVTVRAGKMHEQVHVDTCKMVCKSENLRPIEMIFVEPEEKAYFEELFFVTPVSNHPVSKSPQALQYVADAAMSIPLTEEDVATLPKRIFIRRVAAAGRALVNQDEVERLLGDSGFVALDTSEMPFMLQAGLFRNAELVIGCMGAAMANTVFSPPGTPVGHLAPSGWVEPFYWDLAAARGHPYAVCYGTSLDRAAKPWQSSYRIDLGDLRHLLETFEIVDRPDQGLTWF